MGAYLGHCRVQGISSVVTRNGTMIGSAILTQLTVVTNRHTHRPRNISNNRPHLLIVRVWCGLTTVPPSIQWVAHAVAFTGPFVQFTQCSNHSLTHSPGWLWCQYSPAAPSAASWDVAAPGSAPLLAPWSSAVCPQWRLRSASAQPASTINGIQSTSATVSPIHSAYSNVWKPDNIFYSYLKCCCWQILLMAAKWSGARVIKTSPENTKNAPNENEGTIIDRWCTISRRCRSKVVIILDGKTISQVSMHKQVCVQLPTYADNVALPAFARHCCRQVIDNSCSPGTQQQTCSSGFAAVGPCRDRWTDRRRTPYRFIDPAGRWRTQRYCHKVNCNCAKSLD